MDLVETYFQTGEIRLHVKEGPRNGPPLVLLHGATGSWKDWQPILPLLLPQWHLIIPDLRGHGLSSRSPNGIAGYHISAFASDAISLLLNMMAEPAVIFGHSWGAVTSLIAASTLGREKSNRLRAVVAEDPPVMIYRNAPEVAPYNMFFSWALEMKQTADTYELVLAALRKLNATMPEPRPESALPDWANSLYHLDPDFLRMVMDGSEPVRGIAFDQVFQGIGCPLLLLQADPARSGCLLEEDLALIQAQVPTAQRVYFPGVGHGIHSEQPTKVAKVFNEFIAGLTID